MSLLLREIAGRCISRSFVPELRSLLSTEVPRTNFALQQRFCFQNFPRGVSVRELHVRHFGWGSVRGSWKASSGIVVGSPAQKVQFPQRTIWSSGPAWIGSSGWKDNSWLLRGRRLPILGGIHASLVRRFGSGGYLDPQLVVAGLIATNVCIFFLWRTVNGEFMRSNFVVSTEALKQGRLHTLVSSAFSQYDLHHLLSNMIGLYFFGSEIANLFGGQRLLLLYLTGGIMGSLTHVAYWTYYKPWAEGYSRKFYQHSPGLLGASGAVSAIILLDVLLFPTRIIYFNLIIPVPAALFGIIVIGSDLWSATNGRQSGTSPSAHLGGAIVGALAWLKWK